MIAAPAAISSSPDRKRPGEEQKQLAFYTAVSRACQQKFRMARELFLIRDSRLSPLAMFTRVQFFPIWHRLKERE
jgi:hypothetical protein